MSGEYGSFWVVNVVMDKDLVSVKVTAPISHCGDVVAYLNSIGGWLDDISQQQLSAVILARVPDRAVQTIARWLIDALPNRGESAFIEPSTHRLPEAEPDWIRQLRGLGKSQGYLTYTQVNDQLPPAIVDPVEIEAVVERLRRAGVRVIPDRPNADR